MVVEMNEVGQIDEKIVVAVEEAISGEEEVVEGEEDTKDLRMDVDLITTDVVVKDLMRDIERCIISREEEWVVIIIIILFLPCTMIDNEDKAKDMEDMEDKDKDKEEEGIVMKYAQ